MAEVKRIGVVLGSIRKGRINDRVAAWTVAQLQAHGFEVDVIDPADPDLLPVQVNDDAAISRLRARMEPLAGHVIVTPEYNHAEPGWLKTLIDAVTAEWWTRPVGIVSYGGVSGGLRATESLRVVFGELHAVVMRDTISFYSPWRKMDEQGNILDPEEAIAAQAAMEVFAHRLHWWVDALAEARLARPYTPVAR